MFSQKVVFGAIEATSITRGRVRFEQIVFEMEREAISVS